MSAVAELFTDEVFNIGCDETAAKGPCTVNSTFAIERKMIAAIANDFKKTPEGWEEVRDCFRVSNTKQYASFKTMLSAVIDFLRCRCCYTWHHRQCLGPPLSFRDHEDWPKGSRIRFVSFLLHKCWSCRSRGLGPLLVRDCIRCPSGPKKIGAWSLGIHYHFFRRSNETACP